ncbi:MAG: delta-aminolevulinic acid dehydratase [Nitrospirae bacterium]|nr:delta-aminolevulinic acid dehydratase [Nitrospirota bacterium]
MKKYIEREDFKGYDPYDALNSPLLKALSFGNKYLRIVFTQTLKRLPFNIRPLLFIRKDYNPKGIGLFLWGYAKLYKAEKKSEYLRKIEFFLGLLETLKSKGYSGNCWGYNFGWQSRAFFVPKYTPTIVNSSLIGHALIDTYKYTNNEKALSMALSIKDFILNDLARKNENCSFCFSYTPIDRTAIHNANLLGASLLIRLYRYANDENLKDAALRSLAYSMKYQRDDGSWHYAETAYQKWIDSFHTGFNLQSTFYFLEEGFSEYRAAFSKGVEFYRNNFFLDDGTPKYFHNEIYPIDIHSPAQAIVLFSLLGKEYKAITDKLLNWMVRNMQDEKGFFYFQKTPLYIIKIPYMRWAQAWAFHALTEYILQQKVT